MKELRVFIGWDGREKIAYDVLKYSIEKHTNSNVNIIPLYQKDLRRQGFFQRPWIVEALTGDFRDMIDGRPFSTEFSHSRFLVPELCGFKGWALFMDCDMIFKCDIKEVFDYVDDRYAVQCVKHRQNVKESIKMDGSPQTNYHRKNWSSFFLINCGHKSNQKLTKEVVNTATGGWLHAFSWLQDHEIGDLPPVFNWIEGSTPATVDPKVIHYTLGGPWFDDYKEVMYSNVWWKYYEDYCKNDIPNPAPDISGLDYGQLKNWGG